MAGKQQILSLFIWCVLIGSTEVATATHPDNGPGCGLGKLAWGDYPAQQSISPQVLMGTTNLTFGAQTFGISFGTSGCTNDGTIFASEKVNVFTAVNFDNLAQEMAQGHGEHLTSLATLMDIPAEQHHVFFALVQQKYTMLLAAGELPAQALVKALYALLS